MINYGTDEQKAEWVDDLLLGRRGFAFGITEPQHGSDATWMETRAVRDGDEWVINGEKTWNTGIHKAQYDLIFARTSGKPGDGDGITAFLTPTVDPGFEIVEFLWTFNMPTDHAHVRFTDIRVPHSAIFGGEGTGLQVTQHFFNENRIRQAASWLGAAQFCINESVKYARERKPFGKPLSTNQAIQFPLVELQTQAAMLRALIRQTAWEMDTNGAFSASDKVSMCNYYANRLCCDAADRAMQVHGGLGYSRHKPFEHIYRHHRRYRITEGAEEIQMRRVAGYMFGYMNQQAPKGVKSITGRLGFPPCSSSLRRPTSWPRSASSSTRRCSARSRRTSSTRFASPPTCPPSSSASCASARPTRPARTSCSPAARRHVADPQAALAERIRHGDDEAFEARAWPAIVEITRHDLQVAKPGHDVWEGE